MQLLALLHYCKNSYDSEKKIQRIFHPNVQSTKSKKNVIQYAMKHQTKADLVDSEGNNKDNHTSFSGVEIIHK